MNYKLLEHDWALKFRKKHKKDVELLYRIDKKYIEIVKNPYNSSFLEMKSDKCPKCHRARVGNYRILLYFRK